MICTPLSGSKWSAVTGTEQPFGAGGFVIAHDKWPEGVCKACWLRECVIGIHPKARYLRGVGDTLQDTGS